MTRCLAVAAALAGALGWAGAAAAHQPTFSTLDLTLGPEGTEMTVGLPVPALLHEQDEGGQEEGSPSPLTTGTRAADLAAESLDPEVAEALATLLEERVVLAAGGDPMPVEVTAVAGGAEEVTLAATGPAVVGALRGTIDLFPSDPLHKTFLTVRRGDRLAGQWALDAASPDFALEGPARPLGEVVATFVREGVRHIAIGPDHIAFVLGLILLGGSLAAQVRIVTAFTLAHSVTLTLATLDLVALPPRLVESVIALSIVVVGLHGMWRIARDRGASGGPAAHPGRDPRPLFALGFGLIHGFGFASVLRELDLPTESMAWALGAFNLGVEVGQVAIVLLAALALRIVRRALPPVLARASLVVMAGSVALVGSLWLWQRAVLGA